THILTLTHLYTDSISLMPAILISPPFSWAHTHTHKHVQTLTHAHTHRYTQSWKKQTRALTSLKCGDERCKVSFLLGVPSTHTRHTRTRTRPHTHTHHTHVT